MEHPHKRRDPAVVMDMVFHYNSNIYNSDVILYSIFGPVKHTYKNTQNMFLVCRRRWCRCRFADVFGRLRQPVGVRERNARAVLVRATGAKLLARKRRQCRRVLLSFVTVIVVLIVIE